MRREQLSSQRVQRVEPGGVNYEPPSARLVVWGIHGAGDFVTGLQVGDALLLRAARDPFTGAPEETADQLRIRAMREAVPALPPDAMRDSKGSAVGYFVYEGLPLEHCRPTARHLAGEL